MPSYRYTAVNPQGKWITGEIHGQGRDHVEALLMADGLTVEKLGEAEPAPSSDLRAISRREVAELMEQLAALTRSGLPLPSGLRAAGEELSSPALRATFRDLARRLESGEGLDAALASGGARFPAHVRGLVLAGARSGRLADVLGEYVRGANIGQEMRRKFRATLAYPLLTLALVVALVGFICHLSVRAIDDLVGKLPNLGFGNFGQKSFRQNEVLTIMARFIDAHGPAILLYTLATLAAVWASARLGLSPAARRRLACGCPVVGPLLRLAALTEFCHLLAMLIEAEMPLPEALELAGAGVQDADLSEACGRMARSVAAGNPLSVAVGLWPGVPAGLGQLFGWSEGHQGLAESLHLAGDMFEARTRSQASFAESVLSTAMLLLILWWIGFAIASLYLPLITAVRFLAG